MRSNLEIFQKNQEFYFFKDRIMREIVVICCLSYITTLKSKYMYKIWEFRIGAQSGSHLTYSVHQGLAQR